MERNYYRFVSYRDGSGKPAGIIIKCFTDKELKMWDHSLIFEKIPSIPENKEENNEA